MNLNNDKLVIEELSRMKSLFGYERGKVISEQKSGTPAIDFNKLPEKIDNFWNTTNELVAAGFPNTVSYNDPNFLKYYDRGYSNNTGNYFWTKKKTAPTQSNVGQTNKTVTKTEKTPSGYNLSQTQKTPSGYNLSQTTSGTNTKSTEPVPAKIPTELKDVNGVKAFQDWLDTNKKGWAKGYAGEILNKQGKGYGRMGPRTTVAWGLYKDKYLNPTDKAEPITPQEVTKINSSLMKPGQTSNDYFKNPDGTIKVDDLEPVTVSAARKTPTVVTKPNDVVTQEPPTEPGQTGEYKNGWYWDEKSQEWYQPQ